MTIEHNETELYTLQETAEELKISNSKTYELLATGAIQGFKIGSTWRVTRKALDKYILNMSGLGDDNGK